MGRPRYGWHSDLPTCPNCGNQSGSIEYISVAGKLYSRKHCNKCCFIYDSDFPPGMNVSLAMREYDTFPIGKWERVLKMLDRRARLL